MAIRILPVSEVRTHLATILKAVRKDGTPCFVTKSGRAVAALISIEAYEQLMDNLEDRLDETDETLVQEVREARRQYRTGKAKRLGAIRR